MLTMRRVAMASAITLALVVWGGVARAGQIHTAAADGNLEKVKTLVKGNPDLVKAKDDFGFTALHWAAHKGRKDIVEFLLANKADVNAKSEDERTPLIWAVYEKGHKDVVDVLLANKADVNAEDLQGWTALRWAEAAGDKEVAELLRKNGGKK